MPDKRATLMTITAGNFLISAFLFHILMLAIVETVSRIIKKREIREFKRKLLLLIKAIKNITLFSFSLLIPALGWFSNQIFLNLEKQLSDYFYYSFMIFLFIIWFSGVLILSQELNNLFKSEASRES